MDSRWRGLVGQVIDEEYVLKELVDERNDRATFLAEQRGLISPVNVEILPGDFPEAKLQHSRWSLARDLSHPNLVRIYDVRNTTLNGAAFVYDASERADDFLADVIRTRALRPEEARDVVASVLQCLEYLHSNGLVHGAVEISSVVAVGEHIKLAAGTISPNSKAISPDSGQDGGAFGKDMYGLGVMIVEMLTLERPIVGRWTALPNTNPVVTALPSPLREIAIGCLQPNESRRWTARQALEALAAPTSVRAQIDGRAPIAGNRWISYIPRIVAALVALVIAVVVLRTIPHHAPEKEMPAKPVNGNTKPSPIPIPAGTVQTAERARALPKQERKQPDKKTDRSPTINLAMPAFPRQPSLDWAVIAATYKDFDAAQRRADSIRRGFDECACTVYPSRGRGAKYYVLLGSGLSRQAAERLEARGRASGLPPDTYVTKIVPKEDEAQ